MYNIVLIAHVGGGIATGVVASYAAVVLWQRTALWYRTCALTLGALAAFEVFSGALLAIASSTVSAASLCANIALYMSLVVFVETILFVRMKKASISFPLTRICSPIAASFALMGIAAAYGF